MGGGWSNVAGDQFSTVGGGRDNTASGFRSTIAGGRDNVASGETAVVAGGGGNNALAIDSFIGGGEGNSATGGGSTISGGEGNSASGHASTVGGGGNLAGDFTTGNSATDDHSTVSGGSNNQAGNGDGDTTNASFATVGGGQDNTASGIGSTVPGGRWNTAAGQDSFAAGRFATVNEEHIGSFLFSSGVGCCALDSTVSGEFAAHASGGFRLITGNGNPNAEDSAGSTRQINTAGPADMSWTHTNNGRTAHVLAAFAPADTNPITFDSASSGEDGAPGSALIIPHTVSGTDRMLVVGSGAEERLTFGCDVSGVSYNSVPLIKAKDAITGPHSAQSDFINCASIWYLLSPDVGTHDIVITWEGIVLAREGGGVSMANVAQQGPEATAASVKTVRTTSTTTSITTSTDGAWIFDTITTGSAFGGGSNFTVAEIGQTERFDVQATADSSISTGCTLPHGSSKMVCPGGFAMASDGMIMSDGNPFIYSLGTGNFFAGESAGNLATTGHSNTGFGWNALTSNTVGGRNTAIGFEPLIANTSGQRNTAVGYRTMFANIDGNENTGIGDGALSGNTSGGKNTATGIALWNNTTGSSNTANGWTSLRDNTTGSFNTGLGQSALWSNVSGDKNTAVGYSANVGAGNLTNATAIGANATVNASNKIRLGDSSVSVIEGNVAYTFTSDVNKKENFRLVDGERTLAKISDMTIESWNYKGDDPANFRHYGPTAQEFYAAFGTDDVGSIGNDTTINSGDMAGIMMIAIQAIEERTAVITTQQAQIADQQEVIDNLQIRMADLEGSKGIDAQTMTALPTGNGFLLTYIVGVILISIGVAYIYRARKTRNNKRQMASAWTRSV